MPRPTKLKSLLVVGETLTATTTLTHADSGKTFFLNSATEFATTLPTPKMGCNFNFVVKAAPSGASYTILTAGGANLFYGHIVSSQDAGGSADSSKLRGASIITFADGASDVGDRIELMSDGTNWYVKGSCADYNALTITISPSASPSFSPSASPSLSPSPSPSISPSLSPSLSPSISPSASPSG